MLPDTARLLNLWFHHTVFPFLVPSIIFIKAMHFLDIISGTDIPAPGPPDGKGKKPSGRKGPLRSRESERAFP